MESYVLNVNCRKGGILLQSKTFVPVTGPIFSISNSFHKKSISFVHAAWNKCDSQIVAGDSLGNIYIFHLQKNRFSLIYQLKKCSSFVTFSNDKTQDILVALSDCSIVSLNSESKIKKNSFNHHSSCVFHISFDKTGHTVLSCSKDQAILWDLRSFQIVRLLNLKKNVDIIKVFFLPDKDIIISAFNDNSVFLWNFYGFNCVNQFVCSSGEAYLNIKTIDVSKDEKLIACAGKANWFLIWDIEEGKQFNTISLDKHICSVKQISFLPSSNSNDNYILCILGIEGDVFVYSLKNIELVHKISSINGKIISIINSYNFFQILGISLQGNLELYDLEECLLKNIVPVASVPVKKDSPVRKTVKSLNEKEIKKNFIDVDKTRLLSILRNFEEYPEKHRFFIWSQLLQLPRNEEAFKILHQESFKIQSFVKDYSFMNPGVRKTFLRLMSMLVCWHPVIEEIDYFQCLVYPFIQVLHKKSIMCFEVLVTLISNWYQNWFLFCPFPPFNILCAVENIISFHDRELMIHFMQHNISAEIYAWSLLKTAFSEVFNKKEWLKFWDNVFSNPLSFLLYAVASFNIVMRTVLLQCKSSEQFKNCYQKHGISASMLLKKAYILQATTPKNINPADIIGSFSSIPKNAYPNFFQMSQMKIDLQTVTRKKIIDQEIDYLKQREDALEIKTNYLQELQRLQILRRELLIDSLELKDVEALETLNTKVTKVQSLIQENLTSQIEMLKEKIGENILFKDVKDSKKKYFEFQDYMKKLKYKSNC